jgi:Helix-turn-helix domain
MSRTMFDDDLYTSDTGDTGSPGSPGSPVIPAAPERREREPVVVRRQAALSALIGLGASMLSGLYLWRAVEQGGGANWAIGAVLAGLAMFHITQWVDGRTPLLVADDTGIRLRLGNVWHGLLWQDVSRVTVHERQGLLRDGRVVVHPADDTALDDLNARSRRRLAANTRMYGAPFAIPLGVTTVSSTGDLAGSLAEFADDTTVVELAEPAPEPDRDLDNEPDTVPDTDARTERFTGRDAEPDTEPGGADADTEPDTEPDSETAFDTASEPEPDTVSDTAPGSQVYDERDAEAEDAEEAHTEPDDEYDADWFFGETTAETATETASDTPTESSPEPGHTPEPEPGPEPEPSPEPEPASEPEPSPGPRPQPQWRRRRQQRRDEPAATGLSEPSESPEPPESPEPLEPVQPVRPVRRAVRADVTRRPTVRAPIVGQLALKEPLPAEPTGRTESDQHEGESGRDDTQQQDGPRGLRPRGNMSLVLGETPPPLPPEPEPEPMQVPEETAPDPATNPVIGPVIAEARTLLGLSVDELATRTRIRPHVIEAIEVDDFGPCAGDFYARGHLRALSRVLGVDPAPLVQHFDERYTSAPINARRVFEAELAAGDSGPFRGVGSQGGPRWGALVIAVLVLVLIWILVTILGAGSGGARNSADLGGAAAHVHRVYDGPSADTA